MKSTLEKVAAMPEGTAISVTASPGKGMEATVDLALALKERGYLAIPHLSARMTKDRSELAGIIKRLTAGGIDHAFVIGGDAEDPGDYPDAFSLLRDMAEVGHSFTSLGIAGYPEGHPLISGDKLQQALLDKQPFDTYLATQMCFNARTIALWASRIRKEGVALPVKVGIPGVVEPARLLTIAARIGVGASARFLAKNRRAVFRLLRPGTYRPTRLVRDLGRYSEGVDWSGLHVFTFNQVAPTWNWYQRMRAG
jgi:methylenetetrahydrofolate reductase (NADPH)